MALPVEEAHGVERVSQISSQYGYSVLYSNGWWREEGAKEVMEITGTPLRFIRNALKLTPVFYINSRIKDVSQCIACTVRITVDEAMN